MHHSMKIISIAGLFFSTTLFASHVEIPVSNVKQKIFHKDFRLDEYYKGFNAQGVPFDFSKVIVTVSAFTWDSEKEKYRFAFNQEATLDLSAEEQSVRNVIPAIPPAAIGVALEVEGDERFAGAVRPRRLITALSDFMFNFGGNIRPTEVTLMLSNHEMAEGEVVDRSKVNMSVRVTLDGEYQFFKSMANLQERDFAEHGDVKPLSQAPHITRHSASTEADTFNYFWLDKLNS
jgi:hypothetical protein